MRIIGMPSSVCRNSHCASNARAKSVANIRFRHIQQIIQTNSNVAFIVKRYKLNESYPKYETRSTIRERKSKKPKRDILWWSTSIDAVTIWIILSFVVAGGELNTYLPFYLLYLELGKQENYYCALM